MKKVPTSEDIVTIEDHVKSSEILKNLNSAITFDYELNEKSANAKILKAAKRVPIEVEENSTSSNLIFSAGAWYHVVLPSIKYWNDAGEKTCRVGDTTIKVGGVKTRKENSGKHVNSKVVFFADREKIVCHLYNTTQLVLVNGHGYRKFIDIFLKPFFASKADESIDAIEQFNDEVVRKLGSKTVKRQNIKFKRGPSFPCHSCDFAAKSVATLKKHKKTEHMTSFNSSKKELEPRQSTRNNSLIENLMIEDVTATNLTNEITLEENVLKYTCSDCMFVTISKACIDDHVKTRHLPDKNEEVRFICIVCKHEFSEVEDYDSHVKMHEMINHREDDLTDLQNVVFTHILEQQILEIENEKKVKRVCDETKYSCDQCEFSTNAEEHLKVHIQTIHQSAKVDVNVTSIRTIKCQACEYVCKLNIQMKKHLEKEHGENSPSYKCNLCEFGADFIGEIWNHKLDSHAGDTFNFNN